MKTTFRIAALIAAAVTALASCSAPGNPGSAAGSQGKENEAATVRLSRSDLYQSVSASGTFEPNTVTTIRPDASMPTRKLVRFLVAEGQRVVPGQALAEIDRTGLELDVSAARANYEAQKSKLSNLRSKPTREELAQAEAELTSTRLTLQSQQDGYENTRVLVEKDLAPRGELNEAERQLAIAKARYEAARLQYETVKEGTTADLIQAQESAVAQADNALQKAELVLISAVIRSPSSGTVIEVLVETGDLVSPSTAIMTIADTDPMLMQAQVNENDLGLLRSGLRAMVTPSGFPDLELPGTIRQLGLRATIQGNVSSITATIEVPNPDGRLLWGMNADADIPVLELKAVMTLPSSAIRTVNGASTVTILEGGKQVSWEVEIGASDGTRTQIASGLDEDTEVILSSRRSSSSSQQRQQGGPQPMMFRAFR